VAQTVTSLSARGVYDSADVAPLLDPTLWAASHALTLSSRDTRHKGNHDEAPEHESGFHTSDSAADDDDDAVGGGSGGRLQGWSTGHVLRGMAGGLSWQQVSGEQAVSALSEVVLRALPWLDAQVSHLVGLVTSELTSTFVCLKGHLWVWGVIWEAV
jgi:hypothetical protein